MTTLLLTRGHVYTDSKQVFDNGEHYISPTKVVPLDKPCPIHITNEGKYAKMWQPAVETTMRAGYELEKPIDDTIHGYMVTGSVSNAKAFVLAWLLAHEEEATARAKAKLENLQALIEDFRVKDEGKPSERIVRKPKKVAKKGKDTSGAALLQSMRKEFPAPEKEVVPTNPSMVFMETVEARWQCTSRFVMSSGRDSFTIVFFGEKADYGFNFHLGENLFRLYPRNMTHAFGSGAGIVMENIRMNQGEPILGYWATMLMDDCTAGFVDQWELPTKEKPFLRREGMWHPRTEDQMREALKKARPVLWDLIGQPLYYSDMGEAFIAGAFIQKEGTKGAVAKSQLYFQKRDTEFVDFIRRLGVEGEDGEKSRDMLRKVWAETQAKKDRHSAALKASWAKRKAAKAAPAKSPAARSTKTTVKSKRK